MRGFLKVSYEQFEKDVDFELVDEIYNDIKMPIRATNLSAGYDLFSPVDCTLKPGERMKIPTGLRVHMQKDEWLGIYIRSSIGFKYNVRLKNSVGIIDADYINAKNEGHIWVALYNHGDKVLEIKKGEAFAQGIFQKYLLVENDEPKEIHRVGGIGSTHK